MMAIAFYIAQMLGTGTEQKKCISIESGLQNATMQKFDGTRLIRGGAYVINAAT